ncbi:MAG: HNH endonuclease signature motif containing protein [Mycobacterium sp.]
MFESTQAALLAEMSGAQRDERVAMARRLLAAGRLCQLRMAEAHPEDRMQWCIDNWEAVAAEVGAELGISRGRASTQMNYGVELLERLPKLGAAFARGEVDFQVIAVAVFRAGLITDPAVLAAVDEHIAARAPGWNAMSRNRVAELVDTWVRHLDPAAERIARRADDDRHVEIGPSRDGLADFWGAVRAPDAAALDRRLDQLAATVCRDDSRTKRQRRADALAALAAGKSAMVCDCGSEHCPARDSDAAPGQVVIHVLAEESTISGASASPGYLPGYGAVPAEAIRDLAAHARLRPLVPAAQLKSEPRYRPSAALADFIRARDLCCRFPGCDRPAEFCDIDHTIPYSLGGPTHPSNLSLKCRVHHLLKTFWCGQNGWREQQFADGTIIWTSPSGRTYTTKPGGALFFPQLATPTEKLTVAAGQSESSAPGRNLLMPARQRTRAAERAARVSWERGVNEARWAADPPPF